MSNTQLIIVQISPKNSRFFMRDLRKKLTLGIFSETGGGISPDHPFLKVLLFGRTTPAHIRFEKFAKIYIGFEILIRVYHF